MTINYKTSDNVFFLVEVQGKNQPFNYPISNPEGLTVEELTGKSADFFTLEVLKNLYGTDATCYNGSIDDWAEWIAKGCWYEIGKDPETGEPIKRQLNPIDLSPHPTQTRLIDGFQISDDTYDLLNQGKTKEFIELVFGKAKRPKK